MSTVTSLNQTGFKLTSAKRFISLEYEKYITQQRIQVLKSLLCDLEILCEVPSNGPNIRHITDNLRNIIEYKENLLEKRRLFEISISSVIFSINKIEDPSELYKLFYLINPFLAEQLLV